jgi:hypothetical protein
MIKIRERKITGINHWIARNLSLVYWALSGIILEWVAAQVCFCKEVEVDKIIIEMGIQHIILLLRKTD